MKSCDIFHILIVCCRRERCCTTVLSVFSWFTPPTCIHESARVPPHSSITSRQRAGAFWKGAFFFFLLVKCANLSVGFQQVITRGHIMKCHGAWISWKLGGLKSTNSSSTGGGPTSSLSSSSSLPAPEPAPVKPTNYRDAIGVILRFFKIPVVIQFLATRMWSLFTFFEKVLLPAVDTSVGPEVIVLRLLPNCVHPNAMSWMFNDSSWLPHEDNSKFGPVTKDCLKYSLAIVRNSLDPKQTNFYNHALSSAASKPDRKGSGSASAGSRHHKKPAQVNAALLAPAPAAAAPAAAAAPTPSVVSAGAGGGAAAAADGITITALLARVEQLEARDQRHQQELAKQRVESLEKEVALHRRLNEQDARRAFTAAQDSQGGATTGSSLSLVPHPHFNRGSGGVRDS